MLLILGGRHAFPFLFSSFLEGLRLFSQLRGFLSLRLVSSGGRFPQFLRGVFFVPGVGGGTISIDAISDNCRYSPVAVCDSIDNIDYRLELRYV